MLEDLKEMLESHDWYYTYSYDERIIQRLKYLDVVGEPRRRVGDSVTVNVNKQKRIGIIKGTL